MLRFYAGGFQIPRLEDKRIIGITLDVIRLYSFFYLHPGAWYLAFGL
jgi:hypothetical protein